MTDRDNEIRQRCEAATPGPWYNIENWAITTREEKPTRDCFIGSVRATDAVFIAASRQDIPYLLDRVEELEREIELTKKMYAKACEGKCESDAELERLREAQKVAGETSDGYHTFNELYHHRAVLFSVICNDRPALAWKSLKHHDGTMFDGMFIVGIETEYGQATYHYDIDPYWEMFLVRELDRAPEWDGHTADQAIERISKLREANGWIPTSERMPTKEDADRFGAVSVWDGARAGDAMYYLVEHLPVDYWKKTPEPPKEEL